MISFLLRQDLPGSQTGSRTHRDQKKRGRRGRSLSKQPQKGDRPIRDQEEERSDRQEDTETHNTAISMVTVDTMYLIHALYIYIYTRLLIDD